MEAALEAGVERFVFTSTMGTLGQNPGGLVDEEIPFNWLDRASPYIRARLEAENRFFQYCRERGLPGVALCVANTYGPEDYQPTPHNGMLWLVGSGKVRWALAGAAPTVDIRDVAEAALLAETRGRIGERYIIANEYLDNRELYALAAQALGNRPPRMVPRSLAYAVAWLAERILPLFGVRDFLLTTDAVYLAHAFGPMDTAKARRELGWKPRPMRETVADAMAWFAARQGSP
ncbi:MAG: hypothetical protein KatS3mg124_1318 [Porticoccaceae bacterium]|nr:MAG: hypothetical protein KatS3mg124_1318 [Porticoccaceae bacterium]